MANDIKGGFFKGFARMISFMITAAIGGGIGLSIEEETFFAALFAIGGGFIGSWIFEAWWNTMQSSSIGAVLKTFIFTLFTITLMIGIGFIVLGQI